MFWVVAKYYDGYTRPVPVAFPIHGFFERQKHAFLKLIEVQTVEIEKALKHKWMTYDKARFFAAYYIGIGETVPDREYWDDDSLMVATNDMEMLRNAERLFQDDREQLDKVVSDVNKMKNLLDELQLRTVQKSDC